MMVWLDSRDSKKGNPNENYARELMELFSLGIGNYTEKDIREAARAFTGWEIQGDRGRLQRRPARRRREDRPRPDGQLEGEDIVRICLEQKSAPALHRRQAVPLPGQRDGASRRPSCSSRWPTQFRTSDYDFGALVKTMLSSNLFFSATVVSHADQVAGRFRPGHRPRPGRARSARRPWRRRWRSWARTSSTRRRSRAGTAARPGSTARRCCSARTWPWP